jgi:hypothetical protein
MLAGLLRLFGIPMGENVDPDNNEDRDFLAAREPLSELVNPQSPVRSRVVNNISSLIASRNSSHKTWGWKDPELAWYLTDVLSVLNNPYVVAVFRDPGAIAEREVKEKLVTYSDAFRLTLRRYTKICDLIFDQLKCPTFVCSYEISLQRPDVLVSGFSEFAGCSLAPHDLEQISSYVRVNRGTGDIAPRIREIDMDAYRRPHIIP